jgi:protein-tyrosine-phosphatase
MQASFAAQRVRNTFARLVRPIRRTLAEARNRLDRRRHPARHRRAVEGVRARGTPREVVFVCLGNICRSPYAEARLRKSLEEAGGDRGVVIRSVGFILPGRPSPPEAIEAASARGLDLTAHRSQVLSQEVLRRADLVVVMTTKQQRDLEEGFGYGESLHLGDLDPGPVPRRDVIDPFGKPMDQFHAVFRRIDRALEVLADLITSAPNPSARAGDAG